MTRYCLLPMLTAWLLLSGCRPRPTKIEIQPTAISYIMVYNRGDYSTYDRRRIINRDTISRICSLLNRAKQVSLDTVNVKLSLRFARFDFYTTEGEQTAQFSYNITPKDGNILWYRGSRFRSDSLDLYLK